MSSTCNACGKNIVTNHFLECSQCSELYDLQCLSISLENFRTLSQDYKSNWMCPSCLCSMPKKGNTHTPVRGSDISNTDNLKSASYANDNITLHRGSRSKPIASSDMTNLVTEIRLLRQEVLELKQQHTEIGLLRVDVQEIKNHLDSVSASLSVKLLECDNKLASQDSKIDEMNATIVHLQEQVSAQQQASLRNELEIVGITEYPNENLHHIVIVTAKKIGVELTDNELDEVKRVGARHPPPGAKSSEDWKPRPIVVKLLRRAKRDQILQAAKTRRNITSDDIVSGTSSKIYINERLTKNNRSLFRESRLRAALHGFSYCWVRNGAIYVRKADKKPAIAIRSIADLDEKVGITT